MRVALVNRLGFVQHRLATILRAGGHHVIPAGDVTQLINVLDNDAFIDLIIADLQLPENHALKLPGYTRSLNRIDDQGNARIPYFVGTVEASGGEVLDRPDVKAAIATGYHTAVAVNVGQSELLHLLDEMASGRPARNVSAEVLEPTAGVDALDDPGSEGLSADEAAARAELMEKRAQLQRIAERLRSATQELERLFG